MNEKKLVAFLVVVCVLISGCGAKVNEDQTKDESENGKDTFITLVDHTKDESTKFFARNCSSIILNEDGTVSVYGLSQTPDDEYGTSEEDAKILRSWSGVKQIDGYDYAFDYAIAGLTENGTILVLEPEQFRSEINDNKSISKITKYYFSDVKQFSIGYGIVSAVHNNGTVSVKGDNVTPKIVETISRWQDIKEVISIGSFNGFAAVVGLTTTGNILCTNENYFLYSETMKEWTDIATISKCRNSNKGTLILAIKTDGSVKLAKKDSEDIYSRDITLAELALYTDNWSDIIQLSSYDGNEIVGLRSDGSIVHTFSTGYIDKNLNPIDYNNDITVISLGNTHLMGINAKNEILACRGVDGPVENKKITRGECDIN